MTNPIQIHPTRYSHSQLSVYRACALKYYLKYEQKLVPQGPESRHDADYGNAWDAGLTAWYRDGDSGKALEAFAAAYPQSRYPAVLPVNSWGKTFDNGLQGLADYITKWQDEDSHWSVLSVQEKQTSVDGERTLKLDMVIRDDRDGMVYGIDTKTTASYLDNKYWSRYEPNSQVRMYTDHLNETYGDCGGFIINAASFKHRSRAYKGEPAGDWHSFGRMMFNPNASAIQLERDNFNYWVDRVEADKASGVWGYNDQSCHQYGRECEYYSICSAGYSWPRDSDLILEGYRQMCPKVLDGGRCQLDLGHDGDHDPVVVEVEEFQVEEDEVENAVTD